VTESSILPIQASRAEFVQACTEHNRIIVTAPTGSGKSTRVPGFLADEVLPGGGQVICLQPRRLAARMLARRVAYERGTALGGEVGYRVRFDRCIGADTRIIYETDGILLQELRHDPDLRRVGAIVFDEFHERHIFGDILLGLALDLQAHRRPDLKIVVMSATLDAETLEQFLAPCARVQSVGRCFPVIVRYHAATRSVRPPPVWEQAVAAWKQSRAPTDNGHTLIFMPGAHEIRRTISALQLAGAPAQRIFPLYGDLTPAAQDAATAPDRIPKIIVATNIAETSVTIDGVTLVIDSGLARRAGYDSEHGINTLLVEKISRAAADQRAGRAGRTAPGVCLRLWSEEEHAHRPAAEIPEVARLDLSEVVLSLRALGVTDLLSFRWVEAPTPERLQHTEEFLKGIGALRPSDGAITSLGRRLLDFPVHPRWGRLLLTAADYDCVAEAALLAALAQERGLLVHVRAPERHSHPAAARKSRHHDSLRQSDLDREIRARRAELADPDWESDLLLQLRLWQAAAAENFSAVVCGELGLNAAVCRRVAEMRDQFLRIAERVQLPCAASRSEGDDTINILKCLLSAFPDQVARRVSAGSARVEMVHGRRGSLAPESAVRHAELLVAPEIRRLEVRRGEIETRITMASAIAPEWLEELFPEFITRRRRVEFDTVQRRVIARNDLFYHDLLIAPGRVEKPSQDEAAAGLAEEVMAGRLVLKQWTAAAEQWVLRLNCLAEWQPEFGLPAIGKNERRDLIEQICHGAFSGSEIKDRPVLPVLRAWLSAAQQSLLDKYAPERIKLANGRTFKLTYEAGLAPVFSARIQELYDVPECPAIAGGKVRPRVMVLAPNQRPVQITDDLTSFWETGYPQARKELRGRYPKHEWR
jgi:ATP-dependent helicase HrpB